MKRLFALLLWLLWIGSHAQNTWTSVNGLSAGRFGSASFTLNNEGYIVGGRLSPTVDTDEMWSYNPGSNAWTLMPSYPGNGRYNLVAFVIGNIAYVGGGYNSATGLAYNDYWEYIPSVGWVSTDALPDTARLGAAAFTINGKGYVFGGGFQNGTYTRDLWEYDPAAANNSHWTVKASLPVAAHARSTSAAFASGSAGFIIGGEYGNVSNPSKLTDTWMYLQGVDAWSPRANYPDSVGGLLAFTVDSCHFAGLGAWVNHLWKYNISTDSWTQCMNYAGAGRGLASSFVIGGAAYVGMGLMQNFNYASDMYRYDPPTGCALSTSVAEIPEKHVVIHGGNILIDGLDEPVNVSIYDVLGKEIHRSVIMQGTQTLSLPQLSGIYFYTIWNEGGILAKEKFIATGSK